MTDSTEITLAPVELGVVHGARPAEIVNAATEAANALSQVIESRKLYSMIQGKKYVRVEGWCTLATMMGCLPREVTVTRLADGGFEAVVELARITDGAILSRASAECGMDEPTWAKRASYARRSMAVTRATSKACRIAFAFVVALTGEYQTTPAEEMPREPVSVSEDGEVVLPGGPKKWGGFGGQPLSKVPENVLAKCRDWHQEKGRAPELVEAIDEELESRRDGAGSDASGASQRAEATLMVAPAPSLNDLPPAVKLDDLIGSVDRMLRDDSYPENARRVYGAMWLKMHDPTVEDCARIAQALDGAKAKATA